MILLFARENVLKRNIFPRKERRALETSDNEWKCTSANDQWGIPIDRRI